MKNTVLTFDETTKEFVVTALGFDKDADGFLIQKSDGQRVVSPDGNEVLFDSFAGVRNGSMLVFNSDLPSLIQLADKLDL
jgi:hypothetical protein